MTASEIFDPFTNTWQTFALLTAIATPCPLVYMQTLKAEVTSFHAHMMSKAQQVEAAATTLQGYAARLSFAHSRMAFAARLNEAQQMAANAAHLTWQGRTTTSALHNRQHDEALLASHSGHAGSPAGGHSSVAGHSHKPDAAASQAGLAVVGVLQSEIQRLVADRDQLLGQLRSVQEVQEGRAAEAVRVVRAEEERLRQRLVDAAVRQQVAEAQADMMQQVWWTTCGAYLAPSWRLSNDNARDAAFTLKH
jgi:hypothetical protein